MRTRHLFGVLATITLIMVCAFSLTFIRTSLAQKRVLSSAVNEVPPDTDRGDEPFTLNGVTWRNKGVFIERARCSTRVLSLDEQERIERPTERPPSLPSGSITTASPTGPIQVHFHIIRAANGTDGHVTIQTIQDQIAILNGAFSTTPFQFQVASVDRRNNDNWFNAGPDSLDEAKMKRNLHLGTAEELNIYSVNLPGGNIGSATFPWDYIAHPRLDGISVLYSALPGGSAAPYNEGDVVVHNVGHWLGLYHTFQGGCHTPGDSVSDTREESSANFGCNIGRNTCNDSGPDPITNYMDYSDDSCMFEFTFGQSARMDSQWSQYRAGQ
jgi:hypothetical protein